MSGRERGVVQFWNHDRGFGFLRSCDSSGRSVFIHRDYLDQGRLGLRVGEVVEYSLFFNTRGVAARNARRVASEEKGRPETSDDTTVTGLQSDVGDGHDDHPDKAFRA